MNELIVPIVIKWAGKICSDVCLAWGKQFNIDGNAEIGFDLVSQTAGLIIGQFKATGQKAWICEYGSGSKMKPLDLAKYKSSKYWNSARHGTAITGRPRGEYRDLDGEYRWSSGVNSGRNLEDTGIDRYQAAEPRETIRNIVFDKNSWYWINMMQEIRQVVKQQVVSSVRGMGRNLVMRL